MSARSIIEAIYESPELSLSGKTAVTPHGQKLRDIPPDVSEENIVVLRQPKANAFFAEGWTMVYFMDSPENAQKMGRGELPYLVVPTGTFHSGGNPITDVWSKRFQKPGTEHILGLLQGHSSKDLIYIDMMSVRSKWRRNRINSLMIDALKRSYPNAELKFSDATSDGQKFIKNYVPKSKAVIEAAIKQPFLGSQVQQLVYHGTGQKFRRFRRGMQGIIWFTSDPARILAKDVGAQGHGLLVSAYVNIQKGAGWDEYHKLLLAQFSREGLDGGVLPNERGFDCFVFNPDQIRIVEVKEV